MTKLRLRIEYSHNGEAFSYEDFPLPKGMTEADARAWVRSEPGGETAMGFRWELKLVEFGPSGEKEAHGRISG